VARAAAVRACAHATGIRTVRTDGAPLSLRSARDRHVGENIRSIRLLVVVDKLLDESLLEQHSDLRHLVAPQRVSQQRALDSHLNHLERAAQHAAEQAGVLELGALLWQLDEPTRGTPG